LGELSKLKGLGPKSERCLNEIGIFTLDNLKAAGPVRAFVRMRDKGSIKPSLNFLYAMVGAIENVHWVEIAQHEKGKLLMALDDFHELEAILKEEGRDFGNTFSE